MSEDCAGEPACGVCETREEAAKATTESSADMRVASDPVRHLLAAVFYPGVITAEPLWANTLPSYHLHLLPKAVYIAIQPAYLHSEKI